VKQLVILSGKGGTGKTTVAAALAQLVSQETSIVMADADVDAANLELVLNPTKLEEHPFMGGKLARIDASLCTACGTCAEVCRFDAVIAGDESYGIDELACESCASCFYQCPSEAIRMEDQHAGQWYRSETRYGPLFHARLFAGQENSGRLVTLVKQQARLLALDTDTPFVIVDGPPGIGCPVISACAGADLALLVVEPTISGVHDLRRILGTTEHFGVRSLVLINKADLNARRAQEIESFCAPRGTPVVGHVPFDVVVTEAMVQGQPVTAYSDGPVSRELRLAWEKIKGKLEG
jgi:MinD superfamily P-loop ATPase